MTCLQGLGPGLHEQAALGVSRFTEDDSTQDGTKYWLLQLETECARLFESQHELEAGREALLNAQHDIDRGRNDLETVQARLWAEVSPFRKELHLGLGWSYHPEGRLGVFRLEQPHRTSAAGQLLSKERSRCLAFDKPSSRSRRHSSRGRQHRLLHLQKTSKSCR